MVAAAGVWREFVVLTVPVCLATLKVLVECGICVVMVA